MTGRREHPCQINRPQPHVFPFGFGQPEKFLRRENPCYFSIFQINNAICQLHQIIESVLRNQNGFALIFYQPQMFFQFLDGSHVQIRGGFVQQIDFRVHGIDRRKRDFLFLPTRQFKNIAVP